MATARGRRGGRTARYGSAARRRPAARQRPRPGWRPPRQLEEDLDERGCGTGRARGAAPRPASRTAGPGGRRRRARLARTRSSSSRKRRSPAEVGAQHQRVDEEADQPLDLRAGCGSAIGAPTSHVVLAGVAAQQHLEGGEQHHEQRRPALAAERAQPLRRGRGRQRRPARRAPRKRLHRRARPVGRQLEQRAGRRAAPASSRAARRGPSPVSQRRCQTAKSAYWIGSSGSGGRARGERLVERRQLADQHAERPAVRHDVVGADHEQVSPGPSQAISTRRSGPRVRSNGASWNSAAIRASSRSRCTAATAAGRRA